MVVGVQEGRCRVPIVGLVRVEQKWTVQHASHCRFNNSEYIYEKNVGCQSIELHPIKFSSLLEIF